ncbi:hypothetical protein Misp01_01490 [Microtetraspora sp. NBRC 13810]|uniref:YbaB/EbfC family nucleoid-associated protein n=1 Tax=Microtetraspora sp. NBRC 13810 TaxID=3030990 RepID=UPI0024A09D3F|nr:YbaB/EbfC family nucleoid-associated protein [Microtetraspora sp. NBRC 13810]GLW05019.1 hypothetical protein Misp01_01490 [Microtetraspora sp. NBRC 13810]
MDDAHELETLMAQLSTASARMEELVAAWTERTFTGGAEEGEVVATADSFGTLLGLDVSRRAKERLDSARLGEAIVAAVHAAEAAAAAAKDEMMGDMRIGDGPSLRDMLGDARRDFRERSGF